MNVDQLFDNALAVADRIAGMNEVKPFQWFELDMTQAMVQVDDGIWFAAMARESGQKETERQLWHINATSPQRVAAFEASERQARLADLTAKYQGGLSDFSIDVDPVALMTGLANMFNENEAEMPAWLVDAGREMLNN